jgi:hypothetical protein
MDENRVREIEGLIYIEAREQMMFKPCTDRSHGAADLLLYNLRARLPNLRLACAKACEHQTYADARNNITADRVPPHLLRIRIGKESKNLRGL